MNNLMLYAVSVLIWGSTWIAITFQLGPVDTTASIAYRFAIAGAVILAWCTWRGTRFAFSLRDHVWIALLGLAFGLNYALVYFSEMHISSGLVAVASSSMLFMNIGLARLFFGTRPTPEMLAGAALGVVGIALVFWPELEKFAASGSSPFIIGWPVLAAFGASLANMVATRNGKAGLPVLPVNALWMLWTAVFMAGLTLVRGQSFGFAFTPGYIGSLLYLAVFGSVIAFGAYLTLLGRIGPGKASYVAILTPIIALVISTVFEGFTWHATTFAGIALSILGNVLIIRRKAPRLELPVAQPACDKQAA